ncbi:Imm49 family immunity protein [Corallococcus terminator]
MAPEHLPIHIRNALKENRDVLPRVLAGQLSFRSMLAFCGNFRIAGIATLFLTGLSEGLHRHLHRSGRAFLHYLQKAPENELRTSQALPFFDALSACDFDGAAEIARRSRRTWAQDVEYEEDFLFVEFLMQHFFLDTGPAQGEALLERYEKSLQGAEDVRLELCRALLHSQEVPFNECLERFLSERRDRLEELSESRTVADELLATEWSFSVEGLALVRLAERKGIPTEVEYPHVTSISRERPPGSIPEDAWSRPMEDR